VFRALGKINKLTLWRPNETPIWQRRLWRAPRVSVACQPLRPTGWPNRDGFFFIWPGRRYSRVCLTCRGFRAFKCRVCNTQRLSTPRTPKLTGRPKTYESVTIFICYQKNIDRTWPPMISDRKSWPDISVHLYRVPYRTKYEKTASICYVSSMFLMFLSSILSRVRYSQNSSG